MHLPSAIGSLGAALHLRTLVTIAVVCGSIGVLLLVVRPEQWLVERVEFEGQRRATVAELRHLSDLRNGTAVWQVDADRVADQLERHPWVRSATVTVTWPRTVHVEIVEHQPVALLHRESNDPAEGALVYVDEEGAPFLPARPGDLDYPHLTGFEPELSRLHPELGPLAIQDALWLITTLDDRGLVARDRVSEVAFSRTVGFTLVTDEARLVFGHGDLAGQIDRLSLLVSQGLSLDSPTYVDLAPATVAIVRPLRPLPPASAQAVPAGG